MSTSPQDQRSGSFPVLSVKWRRRAEALEARARQLRADGDPLEAAELEGAALDYRAALESLGETESPLEPVPGMPGCRRDSAGRVFYSAAWLGDSAS